MYAPGAQELAENFGITAETTITLTVSLYVLGFAIGPLILAPLSELYGRRIIYYICHVFFIGFTFGCAFSTNVGQFLAFRILAGCAASGPMSVGGGSVADLYPVETRAQAMSLFTLGPLIGPVRLCSCLLFELLLTTQVIGPIIGGFVSQYIGWRWTFRLILIIVRRLILLSSSS